MFTALIFSAISGAVTLSVCSGSLFFSATEGASYGFTQYLTEPGNAFAKAMELGAQVAKNAPLTNFAVLQALPMIAEANPQTGLLMESLMATVAQSDKEAKTRIRAFLDRKTAKVKPA